MGIYDSYRNQNVKIRFEGNNDAAKALLPRAKKIIEKVQGSLDLGINQGINKTQRILLDDYSYLDINISPGVTTPIVLATITSRIEKAAQVGAEIKEIVELYCPGLPVGEPGKRLFTQLMGDELDTPEERKSFKQVENYIYGAVRGVQVGCSPPDNFSGWVTYFRPDLSEIPQGGVLYNGARMTQFGIDGYGNVNMESGDQRWGYLGFATTFFPQSLSSDFDNICGGINCYYVSCGATNFIAVNGQVAWDNLGWAGGGGGTVAGGVAWDGAEPPPNGPYFTYNYPNWRINRGVRHGSGYEQTGIVDQDGNEILLERQAVVVQGKSFNCDQELVFLEKNPLFGCPRGIGVFYNGADGTSLEDTLYTGQALVGNRDYPMEDGLSGWCSIFASTQDCYDLNWFMANVASLCPQLTGGIGSLPMIQSLKFVGDRNTPYLLATPNIQGDLGYAAPSTCGRTFWFYQDSQGYITDWDLQDWANGVKSQESDMSFTGWVPAPRTFPFAE